jgi:hypothetical protein
MSIPAWAAPMSRIISALALPSPAAPAPRQTLRSRGPQRAATTPLPLVTMTPVRTRATVYGFSHISDQGRIAAAEVLPALGWAPGTSLDCRVRGHGLRLSPHPDGSVRVLKALRFGLPVGLRRRCGLTSGTGVLLAADSDAGELVLLPPFALDEVLHPRDVSGGGS